MGGGGGGSPPKESRKNEDAYVVPYLTSLMVKSKNTLARFVSETEGQTSKRLFVYVSSAASPDSETAGGKHHLVYKNTDTTYNS